MVKTKKCLFEVKLLCLNHLSGLLQTYMLDSSTYWFYMIMQHGILHPGHLLRFVSYIPFLDLAFFSFFEMECKQANLCETCFVRNQKIFLLQNSFNTTPVACKKFRKGTLCFCIQVLDAKLSLAKWQSRTCIPHSR